MTEQWDKQALADYIQDLIKEMNNDTLDVDLSYSKRDNYLYLEISP